MRGEFESDSDGSLADVLHNRGDSVWTYGDSAADVNRAGNGLLRLSLQEEQRLLFVLPDSAEFVVA